MTKSKLIRITTVPISLDKLLSGQLKFMNSFYDVIAVSSEKEYLAKIGKKENVATFHLEMSRKITPIQDVFAVLKLVLFLRKEKPLIVHTHTPKAGIVGMLAAFLARVPNRFHTVAGMPLLEESGFKRKILDFVERLTYHFATKVYPNSFGLKNIIENNNYCSSTKLKVLANGSTNGIDTSFFSRDLFPEADNKKLRRLLHISSDDFVFIFVGRLVTDKGINELVIAFEKLEKEQPLAKLLLVGDYENDLDPLSPLTIQIIKQNKSIISVGFQNDVRSFFAIADCLVFPSYREGFPNVVMQAGAMSLPCIVSDINGCNEIIVQNKNGLIIPVKNQNVIFETMKLVISDVELFNEMKKAAREMILKRYEQKVVWLSILKEYQKVQ
ncbi:MAG: glycosyltransferase family 4 protein [Flavobacterium sp.]